MTSVFNLLRNYTVVKQKWWHYFKHSYWSFTKHFLIFTIGNENMNMESSTYKILGDSTYVRFMAFLRRSLPVGVWKFGGHYDFLPRISPAYFRGFACYLMFWRWNISSGKKLGDSMYVRYMAFLPRLKKFEAIMIFHLQLLLCILEVDV